MALLKVDKEEAAEAKQISLSPQHEMAG